MSAGGGSEEDRETDSQEAQGEPQGGQVARTPELGAWASILVVAMCLKWLTAQGFTSIQTLFSHTLVSTEHATEESALPCSGRGSSWPWSSRWRSASWSWSSPSPVHSPRAASSSRPRRSSRSGRGSTRSRVPCGCFKARMPCGEGAKMLVKSAPWWRLRLPRDRQGLMPIVGGLVRSGWRSIGRRRGHRADPRRRRRRAIAAAADYAMARRHTGKQVRMTKKEIRDEHKRTPRATRCSRARSAREARRGAQPDDGRHPRGRRGAGQPDPCRGGAALRGVQGHPRVVAKGAGVIATRIREVAEESRVSLVRTCRWPGPSSPAARSARRSRRRLYAAVAQVLAFVLSRKAQGVAGHFRTPREAAPLPYVPKHRRRLVPAGAGANLKTRLTVPIRRVPGRRP